MGKHEAGSGSVRRPAQVIVGSTLRSSPQTVRTTGEHQQGESHTDHAARAIRWISAILGLSQGTTGRLTDNCVDAHLLGLACARHRMLNGHAEGVIYCSEGGDSAFEGIVRRLGFGENSLHRIPSLDGRIDVFSMVRTVRRDRAAGLCPFLVVASAGAEDTGLVDNLVLISQLCKSEGLWLHVDGSFGGCNSMTASGQKLIRGLAHADSLTLNLQWPFFQSQPLGCLLLCDSDGLDDTLRLPLHASAADRETPGSASCMKARSLWTALQSLGADAFRREMERRMRLADLAEAEIRKQARWHIVTRSQLGVVTFRLNPPGIAEPDADELQVILASAARRKGFRWLQSTRVKGRVVLRLSAAQADISEPDVRVTLEWLFRQSSKLDSAPGAPSRMRREDFEAADTI